MRLTWEDHKPVDSSPSAEDEFFNQPEKTVSDLLDQASLTDKQRFVIECRLGYKDGIRYTQVQVSEMMGISQRAVWKHEQAAKKKIGRITRVYSG